MLLFSSTLSTFYGSVNNALFLGVQNAVFSDSLMFFHHSSTDKIDFVIISMQHETASMTTSVKMKRRFQYPQGSYSLPKI